MLLLLRFYLLFLRSVCFWLFFIFAAMFYFANYLQVYSHPLLSFCCVFCLSTPYNLLLIILFLFAVLLLF